MGVGEPIMRETSCPGCDHAANQHVSGMCYTCSREMMMYQRESSHCGWSCLGAGNRYGLPEGWHQWKVGGPLGDAKTIPFLGS
jgi:hypothetical protein